MHLLAAGADAQTAACDDINSAADHDRDRALTELQIHKGLPAGGLDVIDVAVKHCAGTVEQQMFGAQADGDRLPHRHRRAGREIEDDALGVLAWPGPTITASRKFIDGEPIKPATKTLAGWR